jgi:hypothetical protein
MEGTFDGLARLNFFRRQFGLEEIDPAGRDRLLTLKFDERQRSISWRRITRLSGCNDSGCTTS